MNSCVSSPLVSICVPLFNGAHFVRHAIESVLGQTYSNWELIISDDGSKDDSVHIIGGYADVRLRLFQNKSQPGMEANFNRLLALANGKYIKILCQDDVLHPDCLSSQVAVMEEPQHECVAIVGCASEVIDAAGKRIMQRSWFKQDAHVPGAKATRQALRSGYNIIGEPSSVLLRTPACKQCGLFDARFPYVVDLDYWIRLLQFSDLYFLSKPLSQFRVSTSSAGYSMANEQASQFVEYVRVVNSEMRIGLSSMDMLTILLRANVRAYMRRILYMAYRHRLVIAKN